MTQHAKHLEARAGVAWPRATSLDTMAQIDQAFRNIVTCCTGCVTGAGSRRANNYGSRPPQQILSS